jgi:DNA-binding winged helix-turn-helix (wHTH) protein/Tfp pilus assembly protein PilF
VPTYHFGPFVMDRQGRRLTRDGVAVPLAARHADVLLALLSRAGDLWSKDTLVEVAWRDVAVTDNSLEQAISSLRRALGPDAQGQPYIQTVPRQGYRFVAAVDTRADRMADDALDVILGLYRAWVEGRAALETLAASELAQARSAFERVVAASPDDARAHVGLANACALQFEATRADRNPDTAALAMAAHHAREACRLDAEYGEAWATLGFVLDRTGRNVDARAALLRAAGLEPDNWRHHFRLSLVSWGEARLRAAHRTLALLPGFPQAHWLAATVHVARQSLDAAERELIAGLASAGSQQGGRAPFNSVGLEWLLGLIFLARGDVREAARRFERELAAEQGGHLYARECCANVWYAIGAMRLHAGDAAGAEAAFQETLARASGHPLARVALARADAPPDGEATPTSDAALAVAIAASRDGRHDAAARVVDAWLAAAEAGSHGWLLPVEPLLRVSACPDSWAAPLSRLRDRAT